jgi:hypothetical protein
MIVGVNMRIDYAGGGPGVIRGCPPRPMQEFDLAQFFQYDAAPVSRRSRRPEAAFALAAVLITEHPKLISLIPSQPVRAE